MDYQDFNPEDEELDALKEETEKAILKFFQHMEEKHKKMIDYMEKEGFIEKTEIPGVFKYTPEGLVLMQEQYRKFKKNGE